MKLSFDIENKDVKRKNLWDMRELVPQMSTGAAISLSVADVLLGMMCSLGFGGLILTLAAAVIFAYLIVFARSYALIAIPFVSYGASLLLGTDFASAAVGLAYAAAGGVLALCVYRSLSLSGATASVTAVYAVFGLAAVFAVMKVSGTMAGMSLSDYSEYLRTMITERVTELLNLYIAQSGEGGMSDQLGSYVNAYVTAIVMALPGLFIAASELMAWTCAKFFQWTVRWRGHMSIFPARQWKIRVTVATAVMYCVFFAVMTVTAKIESAQFIYFCFLNLWMATVLPLAATGVNYIADIFRMRAMMKRGGNPVLIIVILAFSALCLSLVTALAFFGVFGTIEEAILAKKQNGGDFGDD